MDNEIKMEDEVEEVEEIEMETYTVYICRACGADYSPGSQAKHRHKCKAGWKVQKRQRPKQPTRITYAHGYGPVKP